MLIDSHCHLNDKKLVKNLENTINEAKDEGVKYYVTVGTSLEDSKSAANLAKTRKDIFSTIGVYPHEDLNIKLEDIKNGLQKLIDDYHPVAIGECGIDISDRPGTRPLEQQVVLFELQIEIALKNNLPIVIHNRNGDNEIINILKKHKDRGIRGVAHCFTSTWETAEKYLDMGFYISFSGIITYKSGTDILDTVQKVPLDRFVIETDAPYLTPQPYRNKINEPKYVKIIAEKVAEVKKESFETVSKHSFYNTCAIFDLKDI